ncbi:MAG: DNA alkylation repair protein [Methylophaga sp.]|nr:MAG: DNA alkylation repair protein [Methylophaga sp.]
MSAQKLMKEGLGADAVARITHVLSVIIKGFPAEDFSCSALAGLAPLELKQRVTHLIAILADYLPNDFQASATILLEVKQHWDWGNEDDALSGFAAWPLIDYVAVYGIDEPELALTVLKDLTPLFSAEFAIRPFIQQHFDITYQQLLVWCNDADEHVRRLVTEGIRPRLPWGLRLTRFCDDPQPIFTLLEKLKDDPSVYVRKSIANNLNDVSKDNPDDVVRICQRWIKDASPQRQFIIRQALRTLVKDGRPDVFPLLGYTAKPQVEKLDIKLKNINVKLGETLEFSTILESNSDKAQSFVLDYKVHYVKANGATTAKVFKWKNMTLQPRQNVQLQKLHPFKLITTRKYYAGTHSIELQINGKSLAKADFELVI